ncbi:hypothetical protein BASA50_001204 [Batrachochytrium salamandrivorans]|uniref:Peptidase S9 prolyl oligopeptidase catalytic domain-containing protein n=1 Tax=Batrachochytrium salamandrivorans TaxID=1357716 RepID=A0ABQ8ERY1_9FUNG|nr:hypothetical protein BASA50_001204 [Batrachochytrium salamandrivorans]
MLPSARWMHLVLYILCGDLLSYSNGSPQISSTSHHQTPLLAQSHQDFPADSSITRKPSNPIEVQMQSDDIPSLPQVWEVLGPFPHGSREVGVDPLSAYGGFESLQYDESDKYPSELADSGWITWKRVSTNADGSVGPVEYPTVRWDFNQKTFGWAVLHHSTYFRGEITVKKAGPYLVSFSNVVSYKIGDRSFVGNIYGYSHSSDSALYLEAGKHMVYVSTSMDVRINGDSLPPKVVFTGEFKQVDVDGPTHGVVAYPMDAILPEILDGHLVTPYASVALLNGKSFSQMVHSSRLQYSSLFESEASKQRSAFENDGAVSLAVMGWVQVLSTHAFVDGVEIPTSIRDLIPLKIAPGQVVPISFQFGAPFDNFPLKFTLHISLKCMDTKEEFDVPVGTFNLVTRTWGDAYKFTYYGNDGSVQYSMVKPPIQACTRSAKIGCPVVVALHGVGVDADSPFWLDSVRRQDFAWVLYPTGGTGWGFDWHGPSNVNVETSLDMLEQLAPGIPKKLLDSIRPSSEKRVYVGHGNGGQGAWWMMTHYPDTALAAVPASSYVKIQHYIPYYMHISYAYADPLLRAIFEASISENDLDLYIPNAGGIPLLARVGGNDEIIPPLHTRRLVRMVNEWSRNSTAALVSEIPDKGHWFDGILNDATVQDFLDHHLSPALNPMLDLPPLPEGFTIQTLNPASTGSKGGIRILQLDVPFRLATIRVHRYGNTWVLNTTNVRRFGFTRDFRQNDLTSWSIDGTDFTASPSDAGPSYLQENGKWKASSDLLWISRERHPSTYGPANLIFSHVFCIVVPSNSTANLRLYYELAQHIASSWYLFGLGGTQIVRDVDVLDGMTAKYNLIILGGPADNLYTRRRSEEGGAGLGSTVKFLPSGGFKIEDRSYELPGTGALFLAPSPTRTRMGLFVAGIDESGLRRAVWTIPFRTGLEVPDYLIMGDEYGDAATGWTAGNGSPFGGAGTKGVGGVFAAGYWNNTWNYDNRCGYLK